MRVLPLAGLAAVVLPCLVASVPVATGTEPTVLARVEGEAITTDDLDVVLVLQKRPTQVAPDVAVPTVEGLLERLIQNRLLEQEGYRNEAEKTPQIRNQIWDLTRHRAMLALMDSISADVSRSEPEEFGPAMDRVNVMFRVSHILVDSEQGARALLDSLDSGESFDALAQRHSRDSSTVRQGGDLGWARLDLYIPEFREALEGRSKGDLAGPVRTEEGWHLLLLADVHTETVGQSPEMKEQLRQAAIREGVMAKIRAYVESLKEKYLVVDHELLASLDYGTEDPKVLAELRASEAVLATLTWRELTVADFSQTMRFKHYHGLEGKPNAGELRDEAFDEWVTELILRHEAAALGFDESPEILAGAARTERRLVREHVLNELLGFPFDPTPQEIEKYYGSHLEDFTPLPRTRVAGAHLQDEASALAFREALEGGASVAWLAERAPGVVDPDPVAYADWIETRDLGIGREAEDGEIIGPLETEGVWAVVKVTATESVSPTPLPECQQAVLASMKRDRMGEVLADALARLEEASEIEVLPDAHDVIDVRLAQWLVSEPTRMP